MKKNFSHAHKMISKLRQSPFFFLFFLLCFLFLASCASYRLIKNLDPESREFLSKVRYIITKQERKIFLNLPPADRSAFIDEFWKKRDLDLDTEENEFKQEYFERIEMANKLFRGSATPGWLQDRGRIYILLGPPHERITFPRGSSIYSIPEEIWYYGFYPIVFIDDDWDGDYDLTPLSARQIAEINTAQMELKPKIKEDQVVFDFRLDIQKGTDGQVLIRILVPFKNIWFKEEENKLRTILDLSLEIFDSSGKKVWEHQKKYSLSFESKKLEELLGKEYEIKIPARLEEGEYSLTADIRNETDESHVRKKAEFTV